jgi:hypothetical protein
MPHSKSKCPRGYGYATGSAYADSQCTACVGGTYSKDDDTGTCLKQSDITCDPGQGYAAGSTTTVRENRSAWPRAVRSSVVRVCLSNK